MGNKKYKSYANSSAVRCRTLRHMYQSSISAAVADFASACKYLCWKFYVRP